MFIEKNRDSPLSTGSISTVPSSIWFFRFSNDKIFENPAGEKNSQKYLNDFIKELDSSFKRQNLSKASTLVTQPMLQLRPNRTELRSMDYYHQIFCRFQKCKRKVPPPSPLSTDFEKSWIFSKILVTFFFFR